MAQEAADFQEEEEESDSFQRFEFCSEEDDVAPVEDNETPQATVRRQQQRLLLLRHASRCPHENDACPVTAHCSAMKRLWRHISECKDNCCTMAHCVSSRYILAHYRSCDDGRCPICVPVRDAISRNHIKARAALGGSPVVRAPPEASG